MGRELNEKSIAARLVYAEAADLLSLDLLRLDDSQLAETRFAQLAIVTFSLAAWQAYRVVASPETAHAYAGFSLGEYSALGAAGVLGMNELLELVQERARLMQEAAEATPGAMFAIVGLDEAAVRAVVSQANYSSQVFAVNFNCPGQIVIAGRAKPAEACAEELKAAGARRLVRLNVNGAFHTPLMADAARQLEAYARRLDFRPPSGPFYSNRTGARVEAKPDWPACLAAHMVSAVRWSDEVIALDRNGCAAWLEFGPGKVLTGLIRRILPGSTVFPVEDSRSLSEALTDICANW